MQSPKLEYTDNAPNDPLYTYDDLQSSEELERKQRERLERERLAALELRKQNSQGKLDELTNRQIPSPYFNENLAKEPLKMSRNNAIAKGFSVIGDMVNLGARAKVNRRQPDNMEAKYMNDFYRNMEMYGAKVDNWNARNSDRQDRIAFQGIQNDNRQEDNKRRDEQFQYQKDNNDRTWEWREGEEQRAIDRAIKLGDIQYDQWLKKSKEEQKNWLNRYGSYYSDRTSGTRGGTSSGRTERVIKVVGNDKQVHEFAPEEADYYVAQALKQGTVERLIEIDPNLFEEVQTGYDTSGEAITKMQLKRGVKETDIIRAYIDLESRSGQDKAAPTPIEYPGAPLREGNKLPDQGQYPKWEGKQQGKPTQTKVPSFFQ